jgi:hypothetical protein
MELNSLEWLDGAQICAEDVGGGKLVCELHSPNTRASSKIEDIVEVGL